MILTSQVKCFNFFILKYELHISAALIIEHAFFNTILAQIFFFLNILTHKNNLLCLFVLTFIFKQRTQTNTLY